MGAVLTGHLDRSVQEVIAEFPGVQAVLGGYGIGCATCAVGTCLLREVIEVHGLSVEQEREALRKIAGVIFPGAAVEIPPLVRKVVTPAKSSAAFSPAVRMLVEEHLVIKRLLALVPWIGGELSRAGAGRNAAEILFSYFDAALQIIVSMNREHEIARGHVRKIEESLASGDDSTAAVHLGAYRDLLQAHVRKEDEILYLFLDSRLAVNQVGEIYSRFASVASSFAEEPARLVAMLEAMEKQRSSSALNG